MAHLNGKCVFIIFLCLAKLTTQYPVTTREATIDDGNANTYGLTTQQEDTLTTTRPSDITAIQSTEDVSMLAKLQESAMKQTSSVKTDVETIKARVQDLLVEMTSLNHRANDSFKHYCEGREIQQDLDSLKISTCREYAASLASLPGMPLPNVTDVTVDANGNNSINLGDTLNFVQLRIRDHKVVLANVSAVELAYICRLYERLGMSCPYREAGLTAQKCRQISGHADSLFYCTTQELLSLVTSQITSYVMNTHVTMSELNVAIDPWRPPMVKTATEVASFLTEKRYGVAALYRVHQVTLMLKDKLQNLTDAL